VTTKKPKRLGRGIEALLGGFDEETHDGVASDTASGAEWFEPGEGSSSTTRDTGDFRPPLASVEVAAEHGAASELLPIELIDKNPFQPRRTFGESEIASLSESLKTHEMLQPLLVRQRGDRYELISGERRLRAATLAGWTHVPVRIREADDRLVAELAIVENLQRKDLDPIEKALSFRRYLDEHDATQEELAGRLKIDRATIANLMRLLDLPEAVQNAVRQNDISAGHARALLRLGDDDLQIHWSDRIKAEGLSVRAIEKLVQEEIDREDGTDRAIAGTIGKKSAGPAKPEQIAELERRLQFAIGCKATIKSNGKGRGRLTLSFKNHAEFEALLERLTGQRRESLAG
jgi:ParB family chromosome partitioning protein